VDLDREHVRALKTLRRNTHHSECLTVQLERLADDGRILWVNPLKGMGYGFITFATPSQQAAVAAQQASDDNAAHAASQSTAT